MQQAGTAAEQGQGSLRFGIFDWIDQNYLLETRELYAQRLAMLELADDAGFWCYHLAEHHGTPLGMAPSPNLFLAAAARHTRRLRLGPLVQLLPLYNPMRNIEEVCMLDHLTEGRLELGVGRGVSPAELAIYGVANEESRERFREQLEILVMGLAEGNVTYHGKYYSLEDAPLPLRPLQKPYPPLWYPSSASDRVPWIAREGFSTLFGYTAAPLEQTAGDVRLYLELLAKHEGEPGRLNGHVSRRCYGVNRHIYVADSESEAIETAREAYARFDDNFTTRPGGRLPASRRGDFDTALQRGSILAGTPETVLAKVQEIVSATGVNYFVGAFAFGSLNTQQVLRSLQLFAEQVIPNVRPATSPAGAG